MEYRENGIVIRNKNEIPLLVAYGSAALDFRGNICRRHLNPALVFCAAVTKYSERDATRHAENAGESSVSISFSGDNQLLHEAHAGRNDTRSS